ncbi:hypothetical protein [Rhodococcus rhodochrous]|uniref:hypothetical protein n=1 Tax=Rhodococcus rhodochrous TaxID=1829 RepID=UPI001783BFC6|nr:hypothetical protein [Rhodococcus rhodochrous]
MKFVRTFTPLLIGCFGLGWAGVQVAAGNPFDGVPTIILSILVLEMNRSRERQYWRGSHYVEVPVAWLEGLLTNFTAYDTRRPSADAFDDEGLATDQVYAYLKGYVQGAEAIVERGRSEEGNG